MGQAGPFEDAAAFAFLFISLKDDAQVFKLCEYMEILAGCDSSPKQQLEPWVKCQSQSTLCALLSPFKLPAIKHNSPLLKLLGVCYLEKE